MTSKRKKAIIRRRIFIALVVALFLLAAGAVTGIVAIINNAGDTDDTDSNLSSNSSVSQTQSEKDDMSDLTDTSNLTDSTTADEKVPDVKYEKPDIIETPTGVKLDASYGRLLLVNDKNPLPQDYKYGDNLTTIDQKYLNGFRNQINKDVWPYMKAMIEAAWQDDVELYVLSPYRSYEVQAGLFQNQVNSVGGDEAKAATVVARPGTSEHNTGLCTDFNMADEAFENTSMYEWLCENAEDYGFILRYPENKQHVTGVIYEAWHWRFVGINNAKEMNKLGVTLEEYIEMKNYDPTMDMYGDDSQNQQAEQIVD